MILDDATRWLAQTDALPADVDAKARLLLLDTVGCLLSGLVHRQVRQLGRALRLAFPGDIAWPTSDISLAPAGAAALGAAAACWDEACDGNAAAHGRPGLPVVPALLALCSTQDVSLRDRSLGALLLALAAGYEIGARAGEVWRIPPGWHVDGSWHSLGVAAAVAHLTGGPELIAPAIEAVACQIPASLYLPISAGSPVRNIYPAHAVLLGMLAAGSAAAGLAMPRGALDEARQRVLRATDAASVTPPGHWTIVEGYLKPYAAVRHTHYGVEAALRLRARHAINADAITAIRLRVYPEAVQYCGNRAPRSAIQAQFSLTYAIAAALVLGDLGPAAYADVDDARITRLEKMVVVEADTTRTRRGANVSIDFAGQRLSESVDDVAGDPTLPMTREQVVDKFRRYTEPSIGATRAAALVRFFLDGDHALPARTCFTLES